MAAAKGLNLRFISKIKVVFNPFQWETASAREFLRILDTQTVRDSNPKCQIHSEISNKKNDPKIEVQFADKEAMVLDTGNMKVVDILSQFNKKYKEKEQTS
ncbi:Hypothetical predicted protein [Paramuricea clavata]|uniref:Large ribosomal subunit protein mL53 n=1 Tax=Paramuricea clavata TaxID=317549 RepID=A0A7D9H8T4_PARCT|nr:Hypothetical predicted protein [Paramuricea clavata]